MDDKNRSIGDVVSDLTREVSTLFREEVALAKAEIQETVTRVIKDAAMIVVGGFVAYTGLLVLIAAAVLALALVVAPWLSALIVGVVIIAIGAILLLRGINDFQNVSMAPERTVRTLKEDAEVVKEKLS